MSETQKGGGALSKFCELVSPNSKTASMILNKPNLYYHGCKFSLPGSLKLHTKVLTKDDDVINYESLYNLRYQVYCHEANFLDPNDYTDEMEYDEYDSVSEHFLTTDETNNQAVVGTVRLVRWSDHLKFPTVKYFQSLLEQLQRLKFPLHSTAEISRLCISKKYRKRTTDRLLGIESYTSPDEKRRKFPVVILELFKNMYLASKYGLGITHWIATFEDPLFRLLRMYGIHFQLLIPNEIDYYGKVRIYGASLQHIEREMKKARPDLYGFFRELPDFS